MKFKDIVLFLLLFTYVVLYELSTGFASIGMGAVNSFKNLLIIVIALTLVVRNHKHSLRLTSSFKGFLLILILLILFEILFSVSYNVQSPVFGLVEVFVAAKYGDEKFIRYLYTSILITTLLSTIPLMYFYVTWGYYARGQILFDKSMQTFLMGFSYILLLMEFTQKEIRHKWLILSILLYLLFCNVFILQSKTSIFVLLVTGALMLFFRPKEIAATLKAYWKPIIIVFAILPFLPIEWEIPDAMKQAANKLTGREMFVLEQNMKEDTYEIRARIRATTKKVVMERPLCGAGFGNMEKVLNRAYAGAGQGESQIMDLLLDGGITYLFAFMLLTLPMVFKNFRLMRKHKAVYGDEFVFYQMVGFLIMCGGNEMLSSLGWFHVGILAYMSVKRTTVTVFSSKQI